MSIHAGCAQSFCSELCNGIVREDLLSPAVELKASGGCEHGAERVAFLLRQFTRFTPNISIGETELSNDSVAVWLLREPQAPIWIEFTIAQGRIEAISAEELWQSRAAPGQQGLRILNYTGSDKFSCDSFLDRQCAFLVAQCQPCSLDEASDWLAGKQSFRGAVSVTVSGAAAIRATAEHFRTHSIPITCYINAEVIPGTAWIWPDALEYLISECNEPIIFPDEMGWRRRFPQNDEAAKKRAIAAISKSFRAAALAERLRYLDRLMQVTNGTLPSQSCRPGVLCSREINELSQWGITFGMLRWSDPPATVAEQELLAAKSWLEHAVGGPVFHLAYDDAHWDAQWSMEFREIAERAGFLTATRSEVGANTAGGDKLRLNRIPVRADEALSTFEKRLSGAPSTLVTNFKATQHLACPPPTHTPVSFGDLRRLTPVSNDFGWSRGLPIDRYYIGKFLNSVSCYIRGDALEVGDCHYLKEFGDPATLASISVLSIAETPETTILGDLTKAGTLQAATFDCIIMTQVFQYLSDIRTALDEIYLSLKPGGVLLATVPGITKTDDNDVDFKWLWRFTQYGIEKLMAATFGRPNCSIATYGNVLTAIAFLSGISTPELKAEELDFLDPQFPVIISAHATKAP
jgi:SAM-dependent methyltransferase